MNRNRHRVVFNAARGLRMVVAECARSIGPGTSSVGLSATALLLALLAPAAWSQIVADPAAPGNQRPTILGTGNGVPLVNITTPSAAGVSLNQYNRFDVGAPGAILNNSRTPTNSQLGGPLPGNPWLATGSARVIVNQVNSNNPSFLNGPIEVAGQRAEVVIANPSGIQVNGAGFINASGVTLTTGTPVFKGGSLDSYIVQRGNVGIFGAGLDARGADYLSILSRATEVNADLWAKHLRVVNGANTVDAATHQPTGAATPIGEPPRFLLDVAHLGGMYAGHIFLVGTDKGLGVNLGGTLAAQQQMELLSDGRLVVKGIRAGDGGFDVRVRGKTVLKGGAITSTQVAMDEQRNDFHSEGGIELQDVHNEARYKAKSSSATVGAGGHLSSSGAGVGSDSDEVSSTTQAGISGLAGNKDARTGDAQTGLAPIFDRERVSDEVQAQVVITKGFGQQAVPVAASYADKQAVALRREGKEEEPPGEPGERAADQ